MNATALAQSLTNSYHNFNATVTALKADEFVFAPAGKWSAGQHLSHLIKSVAPVNLAFWLPKFVLRLLFGTANRPSKTYEELIAKYQSKLSLGGKATGKFVPKVVTTSQQQQLALQLHRQAAVLARRVAKCSEADLDRYILPHPLLGKLTLREMIYFTSYHAIHHNQLVLTGLKNNRI